MGKYNYNIVDRRGKSRSKNLTNRQRFLERAKEDLRKSVKDGLQDRSITSEDDHSVNIPHDGIQEPWFRHDPSTGNSDFILPGNAEYEVGDLIDKPKNGSGGGGQEGSPDGEGDDDFDFVISKDEYYDILFEDLELPDMVKESEKQAVSYVTQRAGYTNAGSPATLDLLGTMKKSLGRRIALKKPKERKAEELQEELDALESKQNPTTSDKRIMKSLREQIDGLKKKSAAVTYIDPIDLRFRNYEKKAIPKSQAVMFCVMDVSASMREHEKDLAKRFYMLLYLFLQRKYQKIDIVFIRHHSVAVECTEEEFFYSRETGGTIVSTGFQMVADIQKQRYPEDDWNIYVAQASDGDNFNSDNPELTELLTNTILPLAQFMCYIEVGGTSDQERFYQGMASQYGLWPVYRNIAAVDEKLQMKKVNDPSHVYAIFRELFSKEGGYA